MNLAECSNRTPTRIASNRTHQSQEERVYPSSNKSKTRSLPRKLRVARESEILGSPHTSEKSYLKSRRKQFRQDQCGKILDILDRNVGNSSTLESSQDSLLERNHSSVGKYDFPSQTSTTTTTTSQDDSLSSPPASPKDEAPPASVAARRLNLMNLFRRDGGSSTHTRGGKSSTKTSQSTPTVTRRKREKGRSKSPSKKSSIAAKKTPSELELIQQKYVVEQVLKSYPKSPCKTFEDHKEFAMAELTQHSNSLCMTPTRVAKLKVMLEQKLKEKIEAAEAEEHEDIDRSAHVPGTHKKDFLSSSSPAKRRSSSTSTSSGTVSSSVAAKAKFFGKTTKDKTDRKTTTPTENTLRTRNTMPGRLQDESTRRTRNISHNKVPPPPATPVQRQVSVVSLQSNGHDSIEAINPESSKTIRAPSLPSPTFKSPRHRNGSVCSTGSKSSSRKASDQKTQPPEKQKVMNENMFDTSGHLGRYTGYISSKTGKPHGEGRMIYKSHDKDHTLSYEGEWNQGQWNGNGTVVRKNGDTYFGEFCDDQFHGSGEYVYQDGRRVFRGRYVMGHRVDGTMKYSDGSVYRGSWYKGKRQGKGVYRFSDGSKFKGEFAEDQMTGYGQLIWPDGSQFIGEFQKGCRHGKGREYDENGKVRYEGLWKDNLPVEEY